MKQRKKEGIEPVEQDHLMGKISNQALLDVLRIGHAAQESSQINELQSTVVRLGREAFHATTSAFFLTCANGQRIDYDQVVGNIQSKYIGQYCRYYHALEPFLKCFHASGTVYTSDQIITRRDLLESEYYNNFLKPQAIYYAMVLFLKSSSRLLGHVVFHRPENAPSFSHKDRAKAELLAPLLSSSLEKTMLLKRIAVYERIHKFIAPLLPGKGVIVLDEFLDLIHANENAVDIISDLSSANGLKSNSPPGLPDKLCRLCEELSRVVKSDGGVHPNTCQRSLIMKKSGKQILAHLRLVKEPGLSPIYLITLKRNMAASPFSRRLNGFKLSPRELEVTGLVLQGLKNSEVAERLFISEHTVEKHLKTIFRKTGVSNRTRLSYLAMKTDLNREC